MNGGEYSCSGLGCWRRKKEGRKGEEIGEEYDDDCLQLYPLLNIQAYLWTLEHRIDGGHGSEAGQRPNVRLLGKETSALGVTGEGQGAQVLQVQMVLPTGRLEKILTGHHLDEKVKGKRLKENVVIA